MPESPKPWLGFQIAIILPLARISGPAWCISQARPLRGFKLRKARVACAVRYRTQVEVDRTSSVTLTVSRNCVVCVGR